MYKNKLHVCTYSIVRFTLRFVNLFVEVSRVCAASASGRVECFFSFLSFKIQRGFANLPTDFVDDDIWANILYLDFFFPRPNPALQSCFVPACMHAYLIIVCGMEEVATMLPKLRWNCIFLVLLPILHLAAPLCIEMGFRRTFFWESRYRSEINIWASLSDFGDS